MSRLASLKSCLNYSFGINPNIWQLPNPLKIFEFEELAGNVDFQADQRILDLGCGRGIQAQLLARRGPSVTGIDPGEKYIRNAQRELRWSRMRSRVKFRCGVLESFGFERESFDKVFSFCVMEHIPNLPEVLRTLHGLLKSGGEIHTTLDALANVHDAALLEKHRTMFKVVRYFRPETVESVFDAAGFRVMEQRYILRGPVSLEELTREIKTGEGSWPLSRRPEGINELRRDEARFQDTDPGIMILCRLKKV